MRLAADALAEGGVSPAFPISEESLVETFLPEYRFWGRDNQKMRYALLVAGATHGGVEVDLLDEVIYWGADDFWSYAAYAAVVWIRAVADSRGIPLMELCSQLRSKSSTL